MNTVCESNSKTNSETNIYHTPTYTSHTYLEYPISNTNNAEYVNYIDVKSYQMNSLPQNVSISTMSLSCHSGTYFKQYNIYNYMELESDNIVIIKPGSNKKIRSILNCKEFKFKSTNKNENKNFYNQLTIIIRVSDDRFINVKLFKNGSIQMTGCVLLEDANIALNKLINRLNEHVYEKKDGKLIKITFVNSIAKLNISKFKIDMINCDFEINYMTNRERLHKIMIDHGILCRISSIHACVNVKHKIKSNSECDHDVNVSIFVFQTGNIIITGAKKIIHIKHAYSFIVKFLNKHKYQIMKKDIGKILSPEEIKEIINSIDYSS